MSRLRALFDGARHRLSMRHWAGLHARADTLSPAELARLRGRAKALGRATNRFAQKAETRLSGSADMSHGAQLDKRATWTFRPAAWSHAMTPIGHAPALPKSRLAEGVTLHHDCARNDISVRQIRNRQGQGGAPYGISFETLDFSGSFLSTAIELPDVARQNLAKTDLFRLRTHVQVETPLTIFARINVRHGPNIDEIIRTIDLAQPDSTVAFDLFYTDVEPDKVTDIWLDFICEKPVMNRISVHDLVVSRQPRASV